MVLREKKKKLGYAAPDLFRAIAAEMLRRGLGAFKTQELSNAVWAHATTQLANARFFVAVEKEALARGLGAFSPQVVCVCSFFSRSGLL